MKKCPDCGQNKSFSDFPSAPKRSDGRGSYCKECMRERSKVSYRKRASAVGRTVREPDQQFVGFKRCPDCKELKAHDDFPKNKRTVDGLAGYCKPCHNARGKASKERLHGGTSYYHRRARYGLELGQWDEMLLDQGDLCCICGAENPTHVDHDHESGKVRGILCFNCKGGLGQLRDRVDILVSAIAYLERNSGTPWQRTLAFRGGYPLTTPRPAAAASGTS